MLTMLCMHVLMMMHVMALLESLHHWCTQEQGRLGTGPILDNYAHKCTGKICI